MPWIPQRSERGFSEITRSVAELIYRVGFGFRRSPVAIFFG
jgi:hypothetical protein